MTEEMEYSAAALNDEAGGGGGKPKRTHHLRVPVSPDEDARVKANAAEAGLSIAEYLRRLALGYRVTGILDHEEVRKLAVINGDNGRLGGLLKMWLTNDEKLAGFPPEQRDAAIRSVLTLIEDNQRLMKEHIVKVLRR